MVVQWKLPTLNGIASSETGNPESELGRRNAGSEIVSPALEESWVDKIADLVW